VPRFVHHVRTVARRYPLEVLVGVETTILDDRGTLDLPPFLPGVDRVYIASHQIPVPGGIAQPQAVRRGLRTGALRPEDVLASLVRATTLAVDDCPAPVVIAHLFSALPEVGLFEDDVDLQLLAPLLEVAVARGAWIELDERWRCPGPRIVARFVEAGVPVVCAGATHTSEAVGRYTWAPEVLAAVHVMGLAA
jgi:putative hydrolase